MTMQLEGMMGGREKELFRSEPEQNFAPNPVRLAFATYTQGPNTSVQR